jgi:hypothetical protein
MGVMEEGEAAFLFTASSAIDKQALGDYLSEPPNKAMLEEYLGFFDMSSLRVDEVRVFFFCEHRISKCVLTVSFVIRSSWFESRVPIHCSRFYYWTVRL